MKKIYFIDIDQTISTGYVGSSVQESLAHYRSHGIDIPPQTATYIEIFTLPEVVRLHEVLPGAVAGVRRLAQLGEVRYATARKPEVEQITRAWLAQQGFPFPEHALFCTGVAEKLVALASFPGSLVLVDDRWQQLLTLLEQYGQRRVLQGLCERLTLVAFGAAKVPESSVVPLLSLPNWSRLEELLLSNKFTEVFVSSSQTRKDFS